MSYWSDRQEKLNKALEKDEEKLKKRLNRIYEEEARRLQRQIAAYYEMYGEDNVIEYRKLLEDLSPEDKRLLIEDMEAFAKKYPKYKHLLPVRESIYKLDRLQGLQESVRLQQMRIGAQEQELIKDHLIQTAYRGVNASAEAMGFGSAFYSMNEDIVKKFVDVPWADNKSFSDRIWENKEKLTNMLNRDIAQGMARGDSYANLTKQLMERLGNVSRRDAYRLIYTEGTYVHAEASITPFEEDFEYFKLSTVGDGKVCSICRGLEDADPVPISKRVPGENFPPLHPWCRCTFTIEVEDWDAWMDDYVAKHGPRAAEEAEQIEENLAPNFGEDQTTRIAKFIINEENYTEEQRKYVEQVKRTAETMKGLVKTHTGLDSLWSGKITLVSKNAPNPASKLPSCNIAVREDALPYHVLHESLHACSFSKYEKEGIFYKDHKAMEELAVEYMARQIAQAENIEIDYSDAYNDAIRDIDAVRQISGQDALSFGREWISQPLDKRESWLDNKIILEDMFKEPDYIKKMDEREKIVERIKTWTGKRKT